MRIYFTLGCILALYLFQCVAQQCGGLLEADSGNIEIPPSNVSCLWVVKLRDMTGIRLKLKRRTMDPITVIPQQNTLDVDFQAPRISLNKLYKFEGKGLAILTPSSLNSTNSLSWTGVSKDLSSVSLSTKALRNPDDGSFQWESKGSRMENVFWAIEPEVTGIFNWTLDADLSQCRPGNACQCVSFNIFQVKPDGNITELEKTCERSSSGSVHLEKNFRVIVQVQINSTVAQGSNLQLTWKSDNVPIQRNVEGIFAGTESGLYVVTFNSSNPTQLSTKDIRGVAFDWSSREVYWAEENVGIFRANLDGTDKQRLIADEDVRGVAIDQTSGNFYYGSWTKNSITVCNHDAGKCSTVVSTGSHPGVYDIAIHESKGYLFWSTWATKIGRANLDGTDKAIKVNGEYVHGIGVDEREDRIYWSLGTYNDPKVIVNSDLNGGDRKILPNIHTKRADVEVDGDTVYYTNTNETAGVFFVREQAADSTLVATFPHKARYITLFGTRTSSQRANPCVNAGCAHLCVPASAALHRCIGPHSAQLWEDDSSEFDV